MEKTELIFQYQPFILLIRNQPLPIAFLIKTIRNDQV